jgi:aconitate hydratase
VIAKAIERIHQNNLVNFAILPLVFESEADYDTIDRDDELVIENVTEAVASGDRVEVHNKTKGDSFGCKVVLSPRQREILAAGGLLNYTRQN